MQQQGLARSLHWLQAALVVFGGFFIVLFSAGAALAEIGVWSLLVWAAVVVVGLAQAYVLLRLAQHYPHKAGGTATYALELFNGRERILAFLSGWGYWIAWTPATALNSYLCAQLMNQALNTAFNPLLMSLAILLILNALNSIGIARVIFSTYILALVVTVPLIVLLYIASQVVTRDSLLHVLQLTDRPSWVVLLKWFFVIAWTGYAVEVSSCFIAETKAHERTASRLFAIAAGWSVLAFVGIPILLALLTDWESLANDPFESLRPLFTSYLGPVGAFLLGLFLIGALLYSSLAFLIPSTRTIYQMALDGLLPSSFAMLNKRGSPQRSIVLDLGLNSILLVVFQHNLISMLAVANVGYMLVFVLLPVAYIRFVRQHAMRVGWYDWLVAWGLLLVNSIVLLVGGMAWGWFIFGVGWILVLLGIPLYLAAQTYQVYVNHKVVP